MSFAQPAALLGLLIMPLIAALYTWRARHRRRMVSSTWLWSEALARISHAPRRRSPLREPLLLFQLLAVLLLTFFLAGPRQAQATRIHQIVVLDGSVAMAATDVTPSRFANARQRLAVLIGAMDTGDSLSLIEAGPRAFLVGDVIGPADARSLLARLVPPGGPADMAGASALVGGLLAERGLGLPRVTYLTAAETPLATGSLTPPRVERIGSEPLNDQRLSRLAVRCLPAGGICEAFATIQNSGATARRQDLAVWTDQQSLGRQSLLLPARGSLDLTFAVPPAARWLKATLLGSDALAVDNTAWAMVPAPRPLRVLLVSDSPGRLEAALRAILGLSLQVVSTGKFEYAGYSRHDFVVLDRFAPDGLPPVPALLISPPPSSSGLAVRASSIFLPADSVDARDPLATGLNLYGMAATGEQMVVPAWARVVVGGRNGPLLMDGVWNGARAAIIPFSIGHSAFAQDLAFPLLIERLARWLVPMPPESVAVGDAVVLPSDVSAVAGPDGGVSSGMVLQADQPGMYTVAIGTGARGTGEPLFAARTSIPGDVRAGPAGSIAVAGPGVSGTVQRDLWPFALLAALVGLGAEWWFYARRT